MKSSVEKLSDTRVKVSVEIPIDELKPEIDQAYAALAQQVQIPGFRRGKAPRQLIEARFGRGAVMEQVVNDTLSNRYGQLLDEHELKVVSQPEIDLTKVDPNSGVDFNFEVDVRPEVEVPSFDDVAVEVPAIEVSDKDVEEALNSLRQRFGSLKEVERAAAKDDFVVMDLAATVDGEPLEEASAEGMSHQVGQDELIEGLDEAVVGLSAGESATFTTTVPGGEHEGKEAEVTVTVTTVKERELPEADDEFAQTASEFDTIEELRNDLRDNVAEQKKSEQAVAIRDAVLDEVLGKTEFPLPETMVDEQVQAQVQQLLAQVGGNEELLNTLLEAQGTSREKFEADARESAEKAVRTQLFLDSLSEIEKPEVSQQDLSDHLMFTAQTYGMDPNQLAAQLQQSGQIANLFAEVRRGKALAAAICKVAVTDSKGEKVDPAEYFGEDTAEEESAE